MESYRFPHRLVPVLVLASISAQPAASQSAIQWSVKDGGNGHWYQGVWVEDGVRWTEAKIAAEKLGGHLATVTSDAESQWIFDMAGDPQLWYGRMGPWLGGYQDRSAPDYREPSAGWRWVSGEPWFAQWSSGEPNDCCDGEDFLHFIIWDCYEPPIAARHWNDLNDFGLGGCAPIPHSYIVEWSRDCNGDGIVDYGQILDGSLADADGNGVPDCCESPADLDGDGSVGPEDLALLLGHWGPANPKSSAFDLDQDGQIGGNDLALVLARWGVCG